MKFLVDKPFCNRSVAVDPPIAQKRPVAANFFHRLQVDIANKNLLAVVRCLCQHPSERIAEKRSAPELESLAAQMLTLYDQYGDRLTSPELRPAGSRLVQLIQMGLPIVDKGAPR